MTRAPRGYEWQRGNLFYGPGRIEPAGKDDFDVDATFVFGADHTRKLEAIYGRLRAVEGKTDPDSLTEAVAALAELAPLTRNTKPPEIDPRIWCRLDTAEKHTLFDELVPSRGATSEQGLAVHWKVVEAAVARLLTPPRVYPVLRALGRTSGEGTGEVTGASYFGATQKDVWVDRGPKVPFKVPRPGPLTIDSVRDILQHVMLDFFAHPGTHPS